MMIYPPMLMLGLAVLSGGSAIAQAVGEDSRQPSASGERASQTTQPGEMNPPPSPEQPVTTALLGGRVIDGTGNPPIENAVVIVRGERILAVGPVGSTPIPADAVRIDVSGQSVLPGLFDSHFHSRDSVELPIEYELQNGITSFRDPGHPFRFYDAALGSSKTMPRIFLCGGHLDGPPAVWPDQAIVIEDAQHARRTVHAHVDRGASAIKVYFRLPLPHIEAVCQAARKRGVPVTAHLELVDADQAIVAGVRGIEHITSFGTALASVELATLFKDAVRADSAARGDMRYRLWAELDLDASARVEPMLETIVQHNVFVSPTLAVFERRPGKKDATEVQTRGFENMLRFTGMCHRAGARVVVGSHTWAPLAERGRAYQRELELLVESGLTPLQTITAATLHGAEFFGVADRLGTLQAGKLADLIVVDGDPSQDIQAMKAVQQVMLAGRWIDVGPAER